MRTKQFKAESKRLLELMINSIYTHREIFLRELISNASDAIDKLYYHSLSENLTGLSRDDFSIELALDKDARTLTITDNGCGMTKDELESNLGTIAKSGSLAFKQEEDGEHKEDIDIIGQFGVGFYSAFMVASRVTVYSRPYGSDEAMWVRHEAFVELLQENPVIAAVKDATGLSRSMDSDCLLLFHCRQRVERQQVALPAKPVNASRADGREHRMVPELRS